jgi:histone deacetylase 11
MSQLDTHNPLDDKRPRDTLGAAVSLPPLERAGKIPFVFHNCYDISLDGVRSLHPFDFKKRSGVYAELERELRLSRSSIYTPERANDALLGLVHEPSYIRALSNPALAAKVMGIPDLAFLPADTIEHGLLDPLRYAVGGTVLAATIAAEHRWAINLSGGFHHAKKGRAEGFCFFADTAIAIRALQLTNPAIRVLSVDLDAHQGNGVAELLGDDPQVCLFDVYNREIYPRYTGASSRIRYNFPVPSSIDDAGYMALLRGELPAALDSFPADLLIYNAGSDIFKDDRLGRMRISADAIYARDEFVFSEAFRRNIPIVMLLSGGYASRSPQLIAGSIIHTLRRHMGEQISERLSTPYR